MTFFDQEILTGLAKIPTPQYPGTLIVTADAQPIFSAQNGGNTILAGCAYGKKSKNW